MVNTKVGTAEAPDFGVLDVRSYEDRMNVLRKIAVGEAIGYRLFHSLTDEHLATVCLPASSSDDMRKTQLSQSASLFATRLWPGLDTNERPEIAHIIIEQDEASEMLRGMTREA